MVKKITEEFAQEIINGKYLSCEYIHDHTCEYECFDRFLKVLRLSWKLYLPVHAVPILIFKFKMLKKEPLKFLFKIFKNTMYSCLFLASYVALFRYSLCFIKNLRGVIDRKTVAFAGFVSGFSLLWEPHSRRAELALYFLPKFLETFWIWLKSRKITSPVPYGEVGVFAFAMAILMYCYQNERKNIKKAYLSLFNFFWGEN